MKQKRMGSLDPKLTQELPTAALTFAMLYIVLSIPNPSLVEGNKVQSKHRSAPKQHSAQMQALTPLHPGASEMPFNS